MKKLLIIFLLLSLVLLNSCTNQEDAPNNNPAQEETEVKQYVYDWNRVSYYESADGLTGSALYLELQNIMTRTHKVKLTYGEIRYLFKYSDADPNKNNYILTFYTRQSINGTWENGNTWNREHVWPKNQSWSIYGEKLYKSVDNSDANAGSDLHHIRPELSSYNSSRQDKAFGESSKFFNPPNEVKGDIARIMFYLAVRYDMDLDRVTVCESIEMLLRWNEEDPVDELEIARNKYVKSRQGNYNAFIDNPWLADLIFTDYETVISEVKQAKS